MAILSRFTRDSRFGEVSGCPLARGLSGDEASCAACGFNVLGPGKPRVGCVLNTKHRAYEAAMAHLRLLSAADYEELTRILARERDTTDTAGLTLAETKAVRDIAERWWSLVGNDAAEQELVTALLRFTAAALEHDEPVRLLA